MVVFWQCTHQGCFLLHCITSIQAEITEAGNVGKVQIRISAIHDWHFHAVLRSKIKNGFYGPWYLFVELLPTHLVYIWSDAFQKISLCHISQVIWCCAKCHCHAVSGATNSWKPVCAHAGKRASKWPLHQVCFFPQKCSWQSAKNGHRASNVEFVILASGPSTSWILPWVFIPRANVTNRTKIPCGIYLSRQRDRDIMESLDIITSFFFMKQIESLFTAARNQQWFTHMRMKQRSTTLELPVSPHSKISRIFIWQHKFPGTRYLSL